MEINKYTYEDLQKGNYEIPCTVKELCRFEFMYMSRFEYLRSQFNDLAQIVIRFRPTGKNSYGDRPERGQKIIQKIICEKFPRLFTNHAQKSILGKVKAYERKYGNSNTRNIHKEC